MTKFNILNDLWLFIESSNFAANFWKEKKENAKNNFFKKGMQKRKKHLQQYYNLYCYGYYNKHKHQLYIDITNI